VQEEPWELYCPGHAAAFHMRRATSRVRQGPETHSHTAFDSSSGGQQQLVVRQQQQQQQGATLVAGGVLLTLAATCPSGLTPPACAAFFCSWCDCHCCRPRTCAYLQQLLQRSAVSSTLSVPQRRYRPTSTLTGYHAGEAAM
jgi:hypothetical protein